MIVKYLGTYYSNTRIGSRCDGGGGGGAFTTYMAINDPSDLTALSHLTSQPTVMVERPVAVLAGFICGGKSLVAYPFLFPLAFRHSPLSIPLSLLPSSTCARHPIL